VSFQILDIVLYSLNGKPRTISFELGKVNIITGASKTGKTALIDVIDYCLGSDECHVAQGPMRRAVSWYGIRLQLDVGQLFIARRVPKPAEKTTSEIYIEFGADIPLPTHADLISNTSFPAFRQTLARATGIVETLHLPPEGNTRPPLAATIRHALLYCFQPQYEINTPKTLFHNQSEDFVTQAIKDTLPYFLGAVTDEHVAKQNEFRRLSVELRQKKNKLAEAEAIRGEGTATAATLLAEARDVGLIPSANPPESWDATIAFLRELTETTALAEAELNEVGGEVADLLAEKEILFRQYRHIKEQIAAINTLARDQQGFVREASEQVSRLKSVDMFKRRDPSAPHVCPLCQSSVAELTPKAAAINSSLEHLSNQLTSASTGVPKLEGAMERLRKLASDVKQKMNVNREKLEALQQSDNRLSELFDQTSRRAHVLGRVSFYLERLPNSNDSITFRAAISNLQHVVDRLKHELNNEEVKEKLDSFLNSVGKKMSEWAARLDLEHSSDNPLRFDLARLTIIADTLDGPVPFREMGSGENWVGHHLAVHFALHDWFTRKVRPVPRFLFLDQPSQVYFPVEFDPEENPQAVKDDDWKPVRDLFRLIFDFVASLDGKFQVIITEHADLKEQWYQDAVAQRWRHGKKLVPMEWLDSDLSPFESDK
jgi:DNA repair ATPase RecN